MNKKELTSAAAKKAEMSQKEMSKALNAILGTMTESLQKGEAVQLLGFGSYMVKKRAARKGFNPATRKPISIKAKKVIKFSPSSSIKLK